VRAVRKDSASFTLIELLIVVAIIAILALIAVPNFLEAQTRAKVSRVKADLRTLATALEAYYVDWNSYSYRNGRAENPDMDGWGGFLVLTTPESLGNEEVQAAFGASGVGLAAPQIGRPIRLFLVDTIQLKEEGEEGQGIKKVFINAEKVEEARTIVDEAGFYGTRIFVEQGPLRRIQLADNLADAVVVRSQIPRRVEAEVLRILRPEGKAFLQPVFVRPHDYAL